MKIDQVRKLSPFDRLIYWIRDRESIRLKKEAGEPPPWTDDEILQRYRFCNVRRMDDRVSRWLLTNWYEPHKDHPNTLYAAALARFVNKPESLELITGHVFCKGLPRWAIVKQRLRQWKSSGAAVFNGAYMVRGNTKVSEDKIGTVIDEYIGSLVRADVKIDTTSMQTTHSQIAAVYGFGSFMAGQVVADLRWAMTGEWRDKHEWAPVGPGSSKGLGWTLYGDEREAAAAEFVSYPERFNEVLVDELVPRLKKDLPRSITSRLEAHDYQNCLCEIGKYNKALFGLGNPKQKYQGL